VRHGSRVARESFDTVDDAIDALRKSAAEIVRDGPLEPVAGFKDYEPGDLVAARLEISTGGLFRRREAGVDVMGDGTLVPYLGVVQKQQLDGRTPDRAIQAVREALR
jgi:hypothetical protein